MNPTYRSPRKPNLVWSGASQLPNSDVLFGGNDPLTGFRLSPNVSTGKPQPGAYELGMKGVPTSQCGINHDVLRVMYANPIADPAKEVGLKLEDTIIRQRGNAQRFEALGQALGLKSTKDEHIVIVVPHDDDALLGIGSSIYTLAQEGYKISLIVCTDGSRGYCKEEERGIITSVRQIATFDAYAAIGIDKENITFLNFPDASTEVWHGNRTPTPSERFMYPHLIIDDSIGLMNSLVHAYRKMQPTTLILTSNQDHHTDHVNVYTDALFAAVQGAEGMWPNKGVPITLEKIFQYGVRKNLELNPEVAEVMTFNPNTWNFKYQAMAPFNGTQEELLRFVYAQFLEKVGQHKVGDFEVLQEVKFGRGPSLEKRLGDYSKFLE